MRGVNGPFVVTGFVLFNKSGISTFVKREGERGEGEKRTRGSRASVFRSCLYLNEETHASVVLFRFRFSRAVASDTTSSFKAGFITDYEKN